MGKGSGGKGKPVMPKGGKDSAPMKTAKAEMASGKMVAKKGGVK